MKDGDDAIDRRVRGEQKKGRRALVNPFARLPHKTIADTELGERAVVVSRLDSCRLRGERQEKQEAERKTIEAQGVAEAQRIINSTISNSYLQWKYIETLKELVNSPNNSFVIAPYDQKLTPMLNFNQK